MPIPQHYEFAISAGRGRLVDYGVVDNQHTLEAKAQLAFLKNVADTDNPHTLSMDIEMCEPDCETSK